MFVLFFKRVTFILFPQCVCVCVRVCVHRACVCDIASFGGSVEVYINGSTYFYNILALGGKVNNTIVIYFI